MTITAQPHGRLIARLQRLGFLLDQAGLIPYQSGADNTVYRAHTEQGRHIIVRIPRRVPSRYGTAAWAADALKASGVPAPDVLWHDHTLSVETHCPGIPLTASTHRVDTSPDDSRSTPPDPDQVRAATHAGALLARVHRIPVRGYGRLSPAGIGSHPTLLDSLLQTSPGVDTDPTGELVDDARGIVAAHLTRLTDHGPRLLIGDCAARHIFRTPDSAVVTGFIDLDSARGGDPLADLAGFSIREHRQLTRALFAGYFPEPPSIHQIWALTVHRARITAAMLLFHHRRAEHHHCGHLIDVLHADLTALSTACPTAVPTDPTDPTEGA